MATSDDQPKKSERLRRLIDFVFGFENKRGDILDYWMFSADGFSYPPQDFYATVEQQLAARKIPSMEITRQEFAEAGMLSDKRLYLRLMRERLAITACAAPFGNIFFFSCRTVYVPALVRLWHILAALFFLNVVGGLLILLLGPMFAAIAVVTLMFAIAAVLRNAGATGPADLDALLLKIPVVATIYADWFREDTYYRVDTRNLYLKLLPNLILEHAQEVCAEKGAKLVRQYQIPPILEELYRPLPPRQPEPEK